MPEITMIMGPPASGKSTLREDLIMQGGVVLSRDESGGKVDSLLPRMEACIHNGDEVILDNTFPTTESRKPFVELANILGVKIHCLVMNTKIEEAQINALCRMWERYGQIFYTAQDIKDHSEAKKDPNIFPIAALFAYKKKFEQPDEEEGFSSVRKMKFVRHPWEGENKALILDYDGVLRESTGDRPYPTKPDELEVWKGRGEKIREFAGNKYIVLGVSNQSGVAKGHLKTEDALYLFEATNNQLGCPFIKTHFCPHKVPPVSCYCRKPQSGFAVEMIL